MSDLDVGPSGAAPAPDGDEASDAAPAQDAGAVGPADGAVHALPEPAGPVPLGVVLRETGNADVDAAVARLSDADELPTAGHVEVYEDVHRGLRDALAALDENRS
ncbi:hypothetical protein [Streptomyces sp. CBMA29]|uniref:hypothetical protein n=1 Tax=Streptomyces sp. CBMA29 TaxID=1896314 RepID=UPI001662071E|nr:hypothetical protein [Streptomyces sp. CBMA29]MBD0740206.1 hypothetical protein [Streptomyces sp. CBMA29]